MEALAAGDMLDSGDLQAPGAAAKRPFEIVGPLGECPHGVRYVARQDGVGVMLTIVDPVIDIQADLKAVLTRELTKARGVSHRSLLPVHAFGKVGGDYLIVEADPGGSTLWQFMRQRSTGGGPLDVETAYTLVAHICNALAALEGKLVHGYVTLDTVHVSPAGRVFLSGTGVGSILTQTRGFARFRQQGRLPNLAPEQLLSPPQTTKGTDIFGAATLFIELVTGRPLPEAGRRLAELGLGGPEDLVTCLERATAPSASARPPDIATFKAELADAVRSGAATVQTATHDADAGGIPPPPPLPDLDPDDAPPELAEPIGAPPAPPAGGYPPPPPQPQYPPPYGQPPGYAFGYPAAPAGHYPYPYPPVGPAGTGGPQPPPWPGPSAQPRRPSVPVAELDALDAATRRLDEALDEDALMDLTEDVGAASVRLGAVEQPVEEDTSLLHLDVRAYGEAADRLATIDGEAGLSEQQATQRSAADDRGNFFGPFSEPESTPSTSPVDLAEIAPKNASDQRPVYLLQRGERAEGPYSANALDQMIRKGELAKTDEIRHQGFEPTMRLDSLDAFAPAFAQGTRVSELGEPGRRAVPVSPYPTPSGGGSRLVTMLIVLLVLAGLGVGGWYLWQQSAGS